MIRFAANFHDVAITFNKKKKSVEDYEMSVTDYQTSILILILTLNLNLVKVLHLLGGISETNCDIPLSSWSKLIWQWPE